ncbi:hypothetical protein ACEU6E_09800 [Halorutilales archaeon Cl-col2-1]
MNESYSVLTLLSNERDRQLLEDWIETETTHEVCSAEVDQVRSRDAEFDLCVLDVDSFERHSDWLIDLKEKTEPVILPYLLLVEEENRDVLEGERLEYADGSLWGSVDDIINVPLRKHEFRIRLDSLLRLRSQSLEIKEARDEYRNLSQRLEREKTKLQKYLDVSEAIVVGLNSDHTVREISLSVLFWGCETATPHCQSPKPRPQTSRRTSCASSVDGISRDRPHVSALQTPSASLYVRTNLLFPSVPDS